MSQPISIPAKRPALSERGSSFESTGSLSSSSRQTSYTRLPTRPSAITNKLSPVNSIPSKPEVEAKSECLILTSLPSVRNCSSINHNTTLTIPRPSRSMTSTPELSHSAATSSSTTPLMSPEVMSTTLEVPSFGLNGIPLTDKSSLARNQHFHSLPADDQYLLYLRDDVGVMEWSRIVEMMREKSYAVQLKGLRTRYCTLKRDIDLPLRDAIQQLNTTQEEVDNLLGSSKCRARKMNSFGRKTMGNRLRVFEEEEDDDDDNNDDDEVVEDHVWGQLAASLRASGLR